MFGLRSWVSLGHNLRSWAHKKTQRYLASLSKLGGDLNSISYEEAVQLRKNITTARKLLRDSEEKYQIVQTSLSSEKVYPSVFNLNCKFCPPPQMVQGQSGGDVRKNFSVVIRAQTVSGCTKKREGFDFKKFQFLKFARVNSET